ncbi:MAG TPA: ATP-binding protein [Candidatus Paceibacterota bacterium]
MFEIKEILLVIASLINIGVIGLIYFKKPLSPHSSFFAVGSLALAFWAVSMLYFELATTTEVALVSLKATYVAALLISLTLYFFSYAFPQGKMPRPLHRGLVVFVVASLILFTQMPDTMVRSIALVGDTKIISLIPFHYIVFASVLAVLLLMSLGRVWGKYFFLSGLSREIRSQLLAIGASASLSGILGLCVGLLLPSPLYNEYRLFWMGPVLTIFLSTTVIYAIVRYRIFNVKLIVGELFVYLLWIFTFVRYVLTSGTAEHFYNGAFFLLVLILGVLLIRSMRNEVAAREKTEVLAQTLAKANLKLKELDRQKTEFVSLASHQLRGPITVIKGYLSLLLGGEYGTLPQEAVTVLEKVASSGQTMALMVDDFLNVSRIELGIMKYAKEDFDFCGLIKDVVAGLMSTAKERGLTLTATCPSEPIMVYGDAAKLRQVVMNLVDNAFKYTPAGFVSVGLTLNDEKSLARLTIHDTGLGIPPDSLWKLFDKFVRGRNAHETNRQGTGLGLYVAKEFVKAHGGKIWAESEGEGKGSTFFVELPIKNVGV